MLAAFWQAEPIPGAGLWLAPAVLHLRDPQQFPPWSEAIRAGHATLEDALAADLAAHVPALLARGERDERGAVALLEPRKKIEAVDDLARGARDPLGVVGTRGVVGS